MNTHVRPRKGAVGGIIRLERTELMKRALIAVALLGALAPSPASAIDLHPTGFIAYQAGPVWCYKHDGHAGRLCFSKPQRLSKLGSAWHKGEFQNWDNATTGIIGPGVRWGRPKDACDNFHGLPCPGPAPKHRH